MQVDTGSSAFADDDRAYMMRRKARLEEHMNIREVPQQQARYGVDPYLDWLKGEGIPVVEDYGVYLFDVERRPRPLHGAAAASLRRSHLCARRHRLHPGRNGRRL